MIKGAYQKVLSVAVLKHSSELRDDTECNINKTHLVESVHTVRNKTFIRLMKIYQF